MEAAILETAIDSAAKPAGPSARRLIGLGPQAYRVAVRVLGSREGAEDVVQQAFLEALQGLRSGSRPDDEQAWFLGVVAHAALKHARTESRLRRKRDAAMQNATLAGPGPDAELVAQLARSMEDLDAKYRLPIALCCEEGLTKRQAAAVLEMPESTVSKYVQVGLELLREALRKAGYAAAPAAVVGALAHTAPPVPATLAAVLEKLAAGEALAKGPGAGATAAAKGGAVVKVIAGVVLAGALAGGAAVFFGPPAAKDAPPPDLSSPPPDAKGPPKREHYAFGNIAECYNGQKKQALTPKCEASPDEAGNVFIRDYISYGTIRCITADGQVIPISGNDYWTPPTGEKEGPAYMLALGPVGGFDGYSGGLVVAQGRPLEGEEKGALYVGGKKIYKNKDGQWWFKTMPELQGLVQIGKDGKVYVSRAGECFRYEDGKLTKVLDRKDYAGKVGLKGHGGWPEECWVVGNDGSFYLQRSGEGPITKVWPDKQRVEDYVVNVAPNSFWDGPSTKTGWYCGPMISMSKCDMRYLPSGILMIHTADEHCARRVKDGRVSTLYPDGEWRENPGKKDGGGALNWFRGFSVAPSGTAFQTYTSHEDIRTYRITGIDWGKATAGPQVEKK